MRVTETLQHDPRRNNTGPGQKFLPRLRSLAAHRRFSSPNSDSLRRTPPGPTSHSPPPSQPPLCRGRCHRQAAGPRPPGGRCGTSLPPGSEPSARRSSRCSAARSPPPPPAPGTTRSPPPRPPSRPTSKRTGPRSTPPRGRTRRRLSQRGTGDRPSNSPSCGSATCTRPSSHPSSGRSRPRRGSSPPPTALTAGSAPASRPSPTASAGPRRPSWPPRWPEGRTWRRSWKSSRAWLSRPTGSVGAFFRSSSPPLGATKRRSSSRRSRDSCYPCTTPRCSAASTSAAPRPLASTPSCSQGIFGKHEMGLASTEAASPNQEDKLYLGSWALGGGERLENGSSIPVGSFTLVDPTWTPIHGRNHVASSDVSVLTHH